MTRIFRIQSNYDITMIVLTDYVMCFNLSFAPKTQLIVLLLFLDAFLKGKEPEKKENCVALKAGFH